ncbi:MAG: NmrA family NAD(P)-binding protein [Vicinamibacterales bacterium]|nr:NmrA family NAD(P)-binding protein [Vicinamibacterales bacterium]
MSKKIIAVTGATGAQGGGLARAILRDPSGEFSLRAITRKPDSDKAKALAAAGAEVVAADLDDPASLRAAFTGAWGAFCLTNFWEHFSGKKETEQGRALAAAAGAAGVQHAIWSTFEDARKYVPLTDDRMPTLQGEYKVAHFDAKADADAAFTEAGVPTTFLLTSGYYENFIHFGWGPQRMPDGGLALVFCLDDAKMPMIGVEDIGKCAFGIFKQGSAYLGKTVGVAGDHLSGGEMAAALTKALGQPVAYNAVPPDVYRSFGFPGADDVGNMFQFKRDFNEIYRQHRSLEESRRLNPELQTLEAWLEDNASKIPLPA